MNTKGGRQYSLKSYVKGKLLGIKNNIRQSPVQFMISCISCLVFVLSLSALILQSAQGMIAQNELDQLAAIKEEERLISSLAVQTTLNTAVQNAEVSIEQDVINSITHGELLIKKESAKVKKGERTEKIILPQYKSLQEQNADMVGWLEIDGTKINYPIMYTQDDFYLSHNFEKKESISGIPYIDKRFSVEPFCTNTIIHGHNMKDGSMFSGLLRYKDFNYYKEHPVIRFDTLYEERNYEIIAVFPSEIYPRDDQVTFKPYQFINAENKQDFAQYIENIKSLSLYETNATAEYGDQLLTLMTCAYHTKSGRFMVVAREIKNTVPDLLTIY